MTFIINSSAMPYEVRCPMHGSIAFNSRERLIIDHPYFQRLRSISQLGFTALVYPGATHSRFSHALGTMFLAGTIFDKISSQPDSPLRERYSDEDLAYCWQIVRFAGLLHDIGHGPFSHAFEALLPNRDRLSLPLQWYREFIPGGKAKHEDYSVALIKALADENDPPLSIDEARDICSLVNDAITPSETLKKLGGSGENSVYPLLKQIISGEIDADRMDYLRRDAYFVGVAYGYFDMDRLIQTLTCTTIPEGLVMAIGDDALYTYENFLMTRFHMGMQVYLHKTVLLFDYFLHQSVKEGEIECSLENGLEDFFNTREETIRSRLYSARKSKWAARIVNRRPFTRLVQLKAGSREIKDRMLTVLRKGGIEAICIREEKPLSNLGMGGMANPPILVYENNLGKTKWRPLLEVSVLLEKYNQIFVIENIYCKPEEAQKGKGLLRKVMED